MNPIYVSTASGGKLNLLDPSPMDVRLTDIAVSLSKICRFSGATCGFWSVAQHSLLCEALLPDSTDADTRLAVLLHDAHEGYIGDIATPVSWALGYSTKIHIDRLKERVQSAIDYAFGAMPLNARQKHVVAKYDVLALATEKARLTLANEEAWAGTDLPAPDFKIELGRWPRHGDPAAVQFMTRVRSVAKLANIAPLRSLGL